MKKVYIISYSKENLGDDLFVDILIKKYGDCNFYLNSIKNTNNIFNVNSNIFYTDLKYSDLNQTNIVNFDAIIYIGGSIFMEHAGGIERINSLIKLSILCNQNNIPIFFLSSNFGPYETDNYKTSVETLFRNCTDVCFRDKYSYNLFKHISCVRYAPDVVFNLITNSNVINKKIGINVLSFKFRNTLKNFETLYFNTLLHTIKNLIDKGYDITLISFCNYEGDTESIDYILNSVDLKYRDKIFTLTYSNNLDEFLSKYSEFEYMICSRFHSMILSCLLNQKIYVLSYSNKLNNVIDDLSLLPEYHQISDLNNDSYIDITDFCNTTLNKNILKQYDNQFSKLDYYLCTNGRSN